jgi:hypothetical protein
MFPVAGMGGVAMIKLGTFLAIAAVIAVLFGIGFVLSPGRIVALYGAVLTPAGEVVGRILGSSLIAIALMFWASREQQGADVLRAVLIAGLVANALDLLIMLHATVSGIVSGLGWASVIMHILLAAGFGYFAFGRR